MHTIWQWEQRAYRNLFSIPQHLDAHKIRLYNKTQVYVMVKGMVLWHWSEHREDRHGNDGIKQVLTRGDCGQQSQHHQSRTAQARLTPRWRSLSRARFPPFPFGHIADKSGMAGLTASFHSHRFYLSSWHVFNFTAATPTTLTTIIVHLHLTSSWRLVWHVS